MVAFAADSNRPIPHTSTTGKIVRRITAGYAEDAVSS
jgi:hypothetical protein